jgi:hypothetical protein
LAKDGDVSKINAYLCTVQITLGRKNVAHKAAIFIAPTLTDKR